MGIRVALDLAVPTESERVELEVRPSLFGSLTECLVRVEGLFRVEAGMIRSPYESKTI